jgi:hypothetical protein
MHCYGPPVLLIGLTFHELPVRFMDSVYQQLALYYTQHQEYVHIIMRLTDMD